MTLVRSPQEAHTHREAETAGVSGHTPDRWTARFTGYSDGWTIYGRNEDGEYLVAENIGSYAEDDEMEAEAEREARLIAAAPDLLEALRRVETSSRAIGLTSMADDAAAAIAKATPAPSESAVGIGNAGADQ